VGSKKFWVNLDLRAWPSMSMHKFSMLTNQLICILLLDYKFTFPQNSITTHDVLDWKYVQHEIVYYKIEIMGSTAIS
jgi:hypothetical protein